MKSYSLLSTVNLKEKALAKKGQLSLERLNMKDEYDLFRFNLISEKRKKWFVRLFQKKTADDDLIDCWDEYTLAQKRYDTIGVVEHRIAEVDEFLLLLDESLYQDPRGNVMISQEMLSALS